MKTFLLVALTAILSTSGLLACTVATTETIPPPSQTGLIPVKKTMKAFGSEQELVRYFRELAEKYKREAKNKQESQNYAYDSATAAPPAAG